MGESQNSAPFAVRVRNLIEASSLQIHVLSLGLVNAYLLETDRGLYLVDAGMPHQTGKVFSLMDRLGRHDLRLIFITHAHLDHYGSAAELHRLTDARLAVHRLDAPAMTNGISPLGDAHGRGKVIAFVAPLIMRLLPPRPVTPDLVIENEDRLDALGLPAQVIHTPGHTPGSSSLFLDSGELFCGDMISTHGIPHVQRYFANDWNQILKSFQKIQALNPTWVYPGHGSRPLSWSELSQITC
jgi:glyoxylase-like metal-dependent hydrolase (beta-lactamase superfamily II)